MGQGDSQLNDEKIQQMKDKTPFTNSELQKLSQRYNDMDELDDIEGVSMAQMMSMPEFIGSPLAPKIMSYYANADTNRIHGQEFLLICSILSDKTDPKEKKEFLFDLFNPYNTEFITHEEIFDYYKALYDGAISDDHILALTYRALKMPHLKVQGRVEKEEFVKMLSDHEVMDRMIAEFNF